MTILYINFGRSGGTILAKCLANLPNSILLSEINPLGGCLGGSPENSYDNANEQAEHWYNIKLNNENYTDSIIELDQYCTLNNKNLIIRDWSFINFRKHEVNNYNPPYKFLALDALVKILVHPFATVRNSIDMWISFGMPNAQDFFQDYLRFVNELIRLEIKIYKYENFVHNPRRFLKKLCKDLKLPYKDVIKDSINYNKITGDVQLGMNSRGIAQNAIKPLPRQLISRMKIVEIEECEDMIMANKLLGYPTNYKKRFFFNY